MRIVVQRVEKAKVIRQSDQKVVGQIGIGLFVLLGIKKGDSEKEADYLAKKLFKLRVMADKEEKMNLSVNDISGSFLIVSQFTLHAETKDGNRPSFINAEDQIKAQKLYEYFLSKMKEKGAKVETGRFGDYMKIETVLDGPVTIIYND
jgi:D-tyrosyl-tRNA(Tyr) deacylase